MIIIVVMVILGVTVDILRAAGLQRARGGPHRGGVCGEGGPGGGAIIISFFI